MNLTNPAGLRVVPTCAQLLPLLLSFYAADSAQTQTPNTLQHSIAAPAIAHRAGRVWV